MSHAVFGNLRGAWIALVAGFAFLILGLTDNGPFIKESKEYSQEIAASSAKTYLSLRLINAAISFAEEVEIGGSVIAVSGSAHPFKVLEPIDDAVERLSSAIFLVGAISGIMAVVLPVLGHVTFVMIGASLMVLAGLNLMTVRFPGQAWVSNLFQSLARLGLLGFSLVLAFSISSWFADAVSDRAWGAYETTLDNIADQMPDLSQDEAVAPDETQGTGREDMAEVTQPEASEPESEEEGLFGKAVSGLKTVGRGAANIASSAATGVGDLATGAVESVRGAAASASASYDEAKNIVLVLSTQSDDLVAALMGVLAAFIFKTVVCPMLILFGLWKLLGGFEIARRNAQIAGPSP